uniref:Uncharacterized protein n=1 Tax=Catagonus wagneri TaxID=51154 RepID=A0A8C3VYB1_9CETA
MERRWVFVLLSVMRVLVTSLSFSILTLVNALYKQGFYCGDDCIRYSYRPDTITRGLMARVITRATVILVWAWLCWKWVQLLRPTVQFPVAFALYQHRSDVLVGLLQGALMASLIVWYISDFFRVSPPQHSREEEKLEQKPSLSLTLTLGEADHNHSGYQVPSS